MAAFLVGALPRRAAAVRLSWSVSLPVADDVALRIVASAFWSWALLLLLLLLLFLLAILSYLSCGSRTASSTTCNCAVMPFKISVACSSSCLTRASSVDSAATSSLVA